MLFYTIYLYLKCLGMKNYLLSCYIFYYSILNNNNEIGNIGSYLSLKFRRLTKKKKKYQYKILELDICNNS